MYSPVFTITNQILKNIGIIEACREVINKAPLLPYYEKKFREEALLRTVHFGTHIEGNELNLSQAEKVLSGAEVVARDRDIQEVINYRKVMEFIGEFRVQSFGFAQGKNSEFGIDDNLVKKIHKLTIDKILPSEKCGAFRKTQVIVKNSATGEISFKPPEAIEVEPLTNDFLAYINNKETQEIHPILKSGIVHYELVRIHPFVDGNGRVARALSTLILFLEGYDIRNFFSLEEYFDKDAQSYYQALQSVEKKSGDLTFWLEYFTKGLAIELSKIKEKIEKISIDGKLRKKLGGKPILLSDRQLKIIEYIQEVGFLQNQAFETLFPMVSEDTILNELKPLLQNRIIKKQGVTKGARYIIG